MPRCLKPKYWGEIEDIPEPISDLASIELAAFKELLKKSNQQLSIKQEQMHKTAGQTPGVPYKDGVKCQITCHTIQLKLYSYKVMDFIENARIQQERREAESGHSSLPLPPQIPPLKECVLSYRMPGDISGRDGEDSDFQQGKGVSPPILNFQDMRKVKDHAVSAIFCAAGFENAKQGVFNILMDVLHQWYHNLMLILRRNVDREAIIGNPIYIDVMEQTFQELGIGSLTALHDFYQESVVKRHQFMQEKCERLLKEYENLRLPEIPPKEELNSEK